MVSHIIVHFTVTSGVDLVLIQPFLFYYVSHVVLLPTSIFEHKRKRFESKKGQPQSLIHSKAQNCKMVYSKMK